MTLGIFKYGHIIFKHKLVIIVIIHNIFSKQDLFILQSITSLFVIKNTNRMRSVIAA